jgi:hypothetical protein
MQHAISEQIRRQLANNTLNSKITVSMQTDKTSNKQDGRLVMQAEKLANKLAAVNCNALVLSGMRNQMYAI